MVLYIVLEGVLISTFEGQDIPRTLSDMKLNYDRMDWVVHQRPTDIVILSNQTWIYNFPGVNHEEKFWSKISYVSSCIKDLAWRCTGSEPSIEIEYSIRKPWLSGLVEPGPSLIEHVWEIRPDLVGQESLFVCRPIQFDIEYAKSMGIRWMEK